jgi:hypothetical protein
VITSALHCGGYVKSETQSDRKIPIDICVLIA